MGVNGVMVVTQFRNKQDGGDSRYKKDSESSWGNRGGGAWSEQDGGSSWNKKGGESSWSNQVGESSWGQKPDGNVEDHSKGRSDQKDSWENSKGGFGGWKNGGIGNRDADQDGSWGNDKSFVKHRMGLLGSLTMLLLMILLFCSLRVVTAQTNSTGDAQALDALLQDYAYQALVRPRIKTGRVYDGVVPSNLTGIMVSAMRLMSGSLRKHGVIMYKEFEIPMGVVEKPYVKRLVLVYQNLGNRSIVYYPLHCSNLW